MRNHNKKPSPTQSIRDAVDSILEKDKGFDLGDIKDYWLLYLDVLSTCVKLFGLVILIIATQDHSASFFSGEGVDWADLRFDLVVAVVGVLLSPIVVLVVSLIWVGLGDLRRFFKR